MTDEQPTSSPSLSFGAVAAAYDRGRPGYPSEAVAWLLGDEPRIVLELGAGTGKLTAELVRQGHAVHATDPDAAMLEVLQAHVPGCSARRASAEDIPANDRSVDVVVAGQAFHWFDHDRALPEIARILRPGGTVAVIHNEPDTRIPWVRRLGALIGGQDQGYEPEEVVASGLFGYVEQNSFSHWQDVNRETILDLALSRSSIAVLDEPVRAAKLAEVRVFYDDYGRGMDGMQIPWITRCWRAAVRVRPSAPGAGEPAGHPTGEPAGHPTGEMAAEAAGEGAGTPTSPAARIDTGDGPDTETLLIDFR